MVTGMRPIIATVGKFIYLSKAKITLLKFQSFSNKEFAIQFNKPETTLHESPATTEAVRIASKWQVVISLQPYNQKRHSVSRRSNMRDTFFSCNTYSALSKMPWRIYQPKSHYAMRIEKRSSKAEISEMRFIAFDEILNGG